MSMQACPLTILSSLGVEFQLHTFVWILVRFGTLIVLSCSYSKIIL